MALIVIDPGHGGSDPGRLGNALGVHEKTHALDIGQRVVDIINPNHSAHLTRRTDVFVELTERPAIARRLMADVFVSIHFNSASPCPTGTDNGTETYHHPDASTASINLATKVQAAVTSVVGRDDRGVKSNQDFAVIRPSLHYADTAACLVEVSFLCDPDEENNLSRESYRQDIAQAIANGVLEFLADNRDYTSVGAAQTRCSPQSGGRHMGTGNLLRRFRWPLTVAAMSVLIAALPICPTSQKGDIGIYEKFHNTVIVEAAVTAWQIAGWLFILTFIGALFGAGMRGTWNRRLDEYVRYLRSVGRNKEADGNAKKFIRDTQWLFFQAALLIGLAGVVYFFADSDAKPFSEIDRDASIGDFSPFKRNCCCCTPPSGAAPAQVDALSPLQAAVQEDVCKALGTYNNWQPSERFLLALVACGVLLWMEWLASYAAFLFVTYGEDSAKNE